MSEEKELNQAFWSGRYQTGQTQWDAGAITLPLQTYLDQVEQKAYRILIAGGGNGHEAEYLHRNGFTEVYLLDFAPEPLLNFKTRVPDFPANHLLQQNFFSLAPNQFDLVLEQTFFCALPRHQRSQYARQAFDILQPGGKLVGVLFAHELDGEGPPFGGTAVEYQSYFEPYFHFKHFAPCYNSIGPRASRELFLVLERKNRPQFIA